ncbi:MAG: PVC-type heme-binding CxxCH protein [Mariniblastus sp.]
MLQPYFVRFVLFVALSVCFGLRPATGQELKELDLKDGDRVVLLGSEFIEQQIKFNYLEAALRLQWPKRKLVFRNLGWSGDTPSGIARGYFGYAREGFSRLVKEIDRIEPTVILICYGANAPVDQFESELGKLTAELKTKAASIVLLSHPAAEDRGEKFADVTAANESRRVNSEAIRKNASANGFRFVDLFTLSNNRMMVSNETLPLTTDTIRFNEFGYEELSKLVLKSLLPNAKKIDSQDESFVQLRELVREKNRLYFHRYRPQNETYLRGFRKHEQGQNAKEILEFDALIAQAESRIDAHLAGEPLPSPIVEPDPIKLTFEALSTDQQKSEFTLADGLEINLFASEPMVANPIHMNFDSKGRLWVATSPIYPQIKPGAKPRDEIVVLEDTDNDGRADKSTVFANDLLIPTAILPDERGGCYVANSTEMLHLSDTDGDGVADQRRVVLAGFGTEDTHHIIHTFRWGPDTSLYFNQSIYIHTHMETPSGVKRLMGSGIWRFETEKVNANVLMRGLVNPWGHIFDNWGQSFATDGAGGNGINYAFPGSAYMTAVGFRKVLRGMNPGQPKLCGLESISAGHFSENWVGNLVTNDFRGNRINRFQLSPQGSGYVSKQLPDLLSSKHRAFRPVDVKMAPDGSLFVADWYNPIINHGEVDFRDSRRDYKHGRIWRVTNKGNLLSEKVDFENAELDELFELTNTSSHWNQVQARIELKRRDPSEVQKRLAAIMANSPTPTVLLNAIWTSEAIGRPNMKAIETALASSDHRLRAAAVRVLSNHQSDELHQKLVKSMAKDSHPQVRLEFINAWRRVCPPVSVEDLLVVFNQPLDENLEFALTNALRDTSESWIGRLAEDNFIADSNQKLTVLRNVDSSQTVEPLLKLARLEKMADQLPGIFQMIGERANRSQLQAVFQQAQLDDTFESQHRNLVVKSLVYAATKRRIGLTVEPKQLGPFFELPETYHLAGLWNIAELREKLVAVTEINNALTPPFRVNAIRGLAAMKDWKSVDAVANNTDQPFYFRRAAIAELAVAKPVVTANQVATIVVAMPPEKLSQAQALLEIFLQRRQGARQLAKAFKGKQVPKPVAEFLIKRAASLREDGKLLVASLNTVQPKMKKSLTETELKEVLELVKTAGSAERGEAIYRRDKLGCIKCHSIGGAGGVVGPDMISLGASSPVDYIVQSLIDPNAKIKEGYHTTTLITADGKLVSGKLMSDAGGKITIRDAENKELTFDKSEIDDQKISPVSLMPADLVSELTQGEFVDLVTFLSALGKDGAYKVSSERIVRRWVMSDGSLRYSKVDGGLPIEGAKQVSFELNVTKGGVIGIQIENPDGLRVTLNDMKDNLRADKIVSDLPAGRHQFHFDIKGKNRDSIRVRLIDVDGSDGYAEIVNQ